MKNGHSAPKDESSRAHGQSITASPSELLDKAPTKAARVLVYLRHFGSLNRFEAARLVGDTCLNSTIPALESRYGLAFEHLPEKSPNNWGEPCDVMRYDLPPRGHEPADKVLALMFKRAVSATAEG
ncbi:hypothetical protein D3C72_1575150 [compost metagenome]|jgi:hypothetical protein